MSRPKHPDAGRVFLPFGSSRDGTPAFRVLDDGGLQVGVARQVRDGKPMMPGEDLAVCWSDGYRVVELSGPAQVATPAYRAGWDRTFDRSLN
jgi:hypothetical protein